MSIEITVNSGEESDSSADSGVADCVTSVEDMMTACGEVGKMVGRLEIIDDVLTDIDSHIQDNFNERLMAARRLNEIYKSVKPVADHSAAIIGKVIDRFDKQLKIESPEASINLGIDHLRRLDVDATLWYNVETMPPNGKLHYFPHLSLFGVHMPDIGPLFGSLANMVITPNVPRVKSVICNNSKHYGAGDAYKKCQFYHPGKGERYNLYVCELFSGSGFDDKGVIRFCNPAAPANDMGLFRLSNMFIHSLILCKLVTRRDGARWGIESMSAASPSILGR
jgi:hypothetical protein